MPAPNGRRWIGARLFGLLVVLGAVALLAFAQRAAADEGWVIERFHADIAIQQTGELLIGEAIDVDFGTLEKHGIFRDIPVRYEYDAKNDRVYRLTVVSVTDASGKAWKYERSQEGALEIIKIGDPDKTIGGRQTYRITYRVGGALNAFEDHDELFWNVNGADWPVPMRAVSATVRLPGGIVRSACFEGYSGSAEACRVSATGESADYAATRPFQTGEQLTIVTGLRKGAVAAPTPLLRAKPREFLEYFELAPPTVGAALLELLAGLALLAREWWRHGRDREYRKRYYLNDDGGERIRPLFEHDPVIVEYEPPDKLRPAQLGVVLDERADTKDCTATIVDLAVRGYLTITEEPKPWLFGNVDWLITRAKPADDALAPFEKRLYDGLFEGRDEVKLSKLKGTFQPTLASAEDDLYADTVKRRWFSRDPRTTMQLWFTLGVAVVAAGAGLAYLLGMLFGAALIGIAVAIIGLAFAVTAAAMPARSAIASETLRRALGFRMYMVTAEKDRAAFAEKANLFSAYLPYAIVFGCVSKWAKAFSGIDTAAATSSWYSGASGFQAASFASNLESFSSSMSSTIASTPGGHGSSGFSGGSSGGGGGGGGGGSW
ncbi:MAG: DUF2207 domain-containing protein [Chloroflexota bacterium]|nr:DUF2207 domain-containing protein [Chloroflexota bacterium]